MTVFVGFEVLRAATTPYEQLSVFNLKAEVLRSSLLAMTTAEAFRVHFNIILVPQSV
jgi:hypothetical protein